MSEDSLGGVIYILLYLCGIECFILRLYACTIPFSTALITVNYCRSAPTRRRYVGAPHSPNSVKRPSLRGGATADDVTNEF